MKLAQALILRADTQKRIEQLKARLQRSAQVQQGDSPPEDPQALLDELDRLISQVLDLVRRINRTNATTVFEGKQTLADVLAVRDSLLVKRKTLSALSEAAAARVVRYGGPELKYISTVDLAGLQQRMDALSREHRDLDTRIQEMNWQVELVD